jgi:mannose-6-phosphate isomerase-like protein (cupin superfamily)
VRYVIDQQDLEAFYDEPGERGWILEGFKHGLTTTSAIITETAPGGGPPLHIHHTEELHVLPACRMEYIIGDDRFHVTGPTVIAIPAKAPHTFVNRGDTPISLVCFFPSYNFWTNYEELGPNPLLP